MDGVAGASLGRCSLQYKASHCKAVCEFLNFRIVKTLLFLHQNCKKEQICTYINTWYTWWMHMYMYAYICHVMRSSSCHTVSCLWANLTCWPQFSSRAGCVRGAGWVLGNIGHEHVITNLKGPAFLMDLQWDSYTKLSSLTAVVLKLNCGLESLGGLWKEVTLLHPRVSDSLSLCLFITSSQGM